MKTHWQQVKCEFLSSSFITECHLQYEFLCLIRNLKKTKQIKKKKKEIAAERFSIESHKTETSNQCGLSEERNIPLRADENLS